MSFGVARIRGNVYAGRLIRVGPIRWSDSGTGDEFETFKEAEEVAQAFTHYFRVKGEGYRCNAVLNDDGRTWNE